MLIVYPSESRVFVIPQESVVGAPFYQIPAE